MILFRPIIGKKQSVLTQRKGLTAWPTPRVSAMYLVSFVLLSWPPPTGPARPKVKRFLKRKRRAQIAWWTSQVTSYSYYQHGQPHGRRSGCVSFFFDSSFSQACQGFVSARRSQGEFLGCPNWAVGGVTSSRAVSYNSSHVCLCM